MAMPFCEGDGAQICAGKKCSEELERILSPKRFFGRKACLRAIFFTINSSSPYGFLERVAADAKYQDAAMDNSMAQILLHLANASFLPVIKVVPSNATPKIARYIACWK